MTFIVIVKSVCSCEEKLHDISCGQPKLFSDHHIALQTFELDSRISSKIIFFS